MLEQHLADARIVVTISLNAIVARLLLEGIAFVGKSEQRKMDVIRETKLEVWRQREALKQADLEDLNAFGREVERLVAYARASQELSDAPAPPCTWRFSSRARRPTRRY